MPTLLSNATTPTTVEVSGATFTSGFAYFSYAGVTATGPSGTCGTPVQSGILPIPSSDVSSYRGHAAAMAIAGDVQYPFNFADLAPNPVPWPAWISQETCFTQQEYPQCQTITQAAYRPWIVYPSAFWSLNSQWSNCVSGIFGIMDPPTALPEARGIVTPTAPTSEVSGKPTSAAVSKQRPSPNGAIATSSQRAAPSSDPPKTTDAPSGTGVGIPSTVRRPNSEAVEEAVFALEGHTYTAYPQGMIVEGDTTVTFMHQFPITLDGHTLSMGRAELWIDATPIPFERTHTAATSRSPSLKNTTRTVAITSSDPTRHTTLPEVVSADPSHHVVATSSSRRYTSKIEQSPIVSTARSLASSQRCIRHSVYTAMILLITTLLVI